MQVPSSRRFRQAGRDRPPGAHSPRASSRRHRSVPRGTDCLLPAGRCSRERLDGAHGRDGGDAGVRSCNAKGQGESSRSLASADPRPTSCVGAGCMSRRRRERLWRSGRAGMAAGITRCDGNGATRLGAVPRSSAGADPSRGAGRWSYRGAALRLASCTRQRRATGNATRSLLGQSDAERGRTTGRHEYRQRARFAQPTLLGANFMPDPPDRLAHQPRRTPRGVTIGPPTAPRDRAGARRRRCGARAPRCASRRLDAPPRAAPAPAAALRRAGP